MDKKNRLFSASSRIDFAKKGKGYAICQSSYYDDAYGFGVDFNDERFELLKKNFEKKVISSGVFVYYGH